MTSVSGMNHVHILVRDLSRAIAFYGAVFGLAEAYRADEDGETLVFMHTPADDIFTLHERTGDVPIDPGGLQHFGFRLQEPAGLAATLEAVEANGGAFLGYAGWAPGETVAYVRDPDGYTLEIDAQP